MPSTLQLFPVQSSVQLQPVSINAPLLVPAQAATMQLQIAAGLRGAQGVAGANGQGVPVGGAQRTVLAKTTNQDFDTEWIVHSLDEDDFASDSATTPPSQRSVASYIGSTASIFESKAAVEATHIPSIVVAIRTAGYYDATTGGGGNYSRVGSLPSHSAYIQSADGAYWELADLVVNVRALGAKADASQTSLTAAFTGTDNTTAFRNWYLAVVALGRPGYVPSGTYLITDTITNGARTDSDIVIYGDGPSSAIVIGANVGGIFTYTGSTDGNTTTTVVTTATTAKGGRQFTVNDTSTLTVGGYVVIRDQSQVIVYGYSSDASTAQCQAGQVARIKTIPDSTHFTIYGSAEFDYGWSATASLSTSVRRFRNAGSTIKPAQNLTFRNLQFAFDRTITYTSTNNVFAISRYLDVTLDNITYRNQAYTAGGLADVVGFRITNNRGLRTPDVANYYAYLLDGCVTDGLIAGNYQEGGRHFITTTAATGQICPAHVLVANNVIKETHLAGIDVHAAVAREWTIVGNVISSANNDSVNSWTGQGIQLRAFNTVVTGNTISGLDYGISLSFCDHCLVTNNYINACNRGINVSNSYSLRVSQNQIKNSVNYHVYVDAAVGSGGAAYPDIAIEDNDHYGNPGTACITVNDTFGSDWRFSNNRFHGTTSTKFSGVPDSHAYGIITKTADFTPVAGLDCVYLIDTTSAAVTAAPGTAASEKGNVYTFKKINTGGSAATFDPSGSETVNGATTLVLKDKEAIRVKSDGSAWYVLTTPAIDTDGTLTANSDRLIPSQKAVKTYAEPANANLLKSNTSANLTVGFTTTSYSAGTKSSGTFTPDPANGNIQHYTNGGAHTLAPPSSVCTMVLECVNSSAGALTTSGFTVVDGDVYDSSGTKKHIFRISKTNSVSSLNVQYVTGT